MFLDMPKYTMHPLCLYNYTYSLYQDEVFIQEFDVNRPETIVDTTPAFYMNPIETGLFAYYASSLSDLGTKYF
jgi:hypothetical protein